MGKRARGWAVSMTNGPTGLAIGDVERVAGDPGAGALLICDHASNAIPPGLNGLGLPPAQLERHIAYDIGAAWATRRLADRLGCPAVLSNFSRLLIDPNRGLDDPTLVMRLSDGAIIPGNAAVDEAVIADRIARYYAPYDDAVARAVHEALATGRPPVVISVHSFTPSWKGAARPWHIGLLWDRDDRLVRPLIAALARDPSLVIGDNEPYFGGLPGDTVDRHATANGLANVLVEFRQDLIATPAGAEDWADRLADALVEVLPELAATTAPLSFATVDA